MKTKFKKWNWYKNLTWDGSIFMYEGENDRFLIGDGCDFAGEALINDHSKGWGKYDEYVRISEIEALLILMNHIEKNKENDN